MPGLWQEDSYGGKVLPIEFNGDFRNAFSIDGQVYEALRTKNENINEDILYIHTEV
jgi:hypothetical protein